MPPVTEIVVLSGKGGTGKTSLVASLASLFNKKVLVDCDVDAANLNLLINGRVIEEHPFIAGSKAFIRPDACTTCGKCREVCRFEAISEAFVVDPFACEGCGACYFLCPESAVVFDETLAGHLYVGQTDERDPVVFAELLPGGENSGKLVAQVRAKARELAEQRQKKLLLTDGPPGVGCPVISSLTGASLALLIAEPTLTGIHDLERVVQLAGHFQIPVSVAVNKSDLNPVFTERIRRLCEERELQFLGTVPYEPQISEAQRQTRTILEYAPGCAASLAIKKVCTKLQSIVEVS
jgi:MinD superfamily P-loop ATPase